MHHRAVAPASTLLLVLLATGCGNPTGPSAEAERLEVAMARWERLGTPDYELDLQRTCFCISQDVGRRVLGTISHGVVIGGQIVATGEDLVPAAVASLPTVPDLFGILQSALENDAYQLRVRYHPQLGVPLEITINYDREAVDDEVQITVFAVNRLAVTHD